MPSLYNAREERFAVLVYKGFPPFQAYPRAGYRPSRGTPYRLRDCKRIDARIRELQRKAAMRAIVTKETITEELEEARKLAMQSDVQQPGAAVQASNAKAKLHGLIVEKTQELKPIASMDAEQLETFVRENFGEQAELILAMFKRVEELPEATHIAPDSEN